MPTFDRKVVETPHRVQNDRNGRFVMCISHYFGSQTFSFSVNRKKHFLPAIAGKFSLKLEISIFDLHGQIICLNRGFRGH